MAEFNHSSKSRRLGARADERGVTLIELMVGMVIGLIAVLVISQVMLAAEGQKRTTTSGSDAQLTGTLALYTLQRDLQMSGYGLGANQLGLGCNVRSLLFNTTNGFNSVADRLMAPVRIYPSATVGGPDALRILGSSSDKFSVPTLVTSDHPRTGTIGVTEFVVNNTVGIQAGDLMIAV
ncbi:MAG: prepilin-type N-terminal cleavage/methylation domain-containing protein, partial [Ideonella sp.]